ncbi:peroxidasin-like protein [Leptotrombidium deliense]|uniref:Peroxidasin-like protein n=1 Tax=Leptotrombidium deliense TaxID=299467 RepID=A0A443SN52_9ACAR|nr:peroxidasin-like protein [Leptotrombidium deliense]
MSNDPLEPSATGIALARLELISPDTKRAVQNCKEADFVHCDPYNKYRTADGSCNNLQHPHWGKSFSCFSRLLPPAYADGLSAPRVSLSGAPLPNPRIISALIHRDLNYPATYTHLTMQYGQFFAHDIAFTPSSRTRPREQMNQITSYIDGSQVYGSMENETRSLWTKTGPAGRMHVSLAANGGELLPKSTEPDSDQCSKPNQNQYCFKAGDKRVNQHPSLTALHVLFLRQHNRIVNALKRINPHWVGDKLYEEANVFAEILDDGRPSGYRLRENFFTPFGFNDGQLDAVMRGLISQAAQNRDPFISSDMKNHLYRPKDSPYGLDLPAFNVQRGRDHGIASYTHYLKFCFDDKIYSWEELDQYMPTSQRLRLQKIYKSVYDIDLFTAGLMEYPLPGAAVGPTFTCLIGIQMYNLKFGDRFWFEHENQVGSFTSQQLQELKKVTLAKIICANSDNIKHIQKNVFRGESKRNPIVPCNSLHDTDLRAWRDVPGETIVTF